ncbi:hypothetical protein [Reichenbachiella faecimaris]|uniref:hypothetical protein n=1 Tax=Reichenbachiella faecimaris TaxID=692418 RepID=UPI00111C3FDD|nr:hypothetical protein [Reichenbachiella faecimaris]
MYKYISDYFPNKVEAVDGMPGTRKTPLFHFAQSSLTTYCQALGSWSSYWLLMLVLSVVRLGWMHSLVQKMSDEASPNMKQNFDVAKN